MSSIREKIACSLYQKRLVMTRMVWQMLSSERVNTPVEEDLLKKVFSTPVEGGLLKKVLSTPVEGT